MSELAKFGVAIQTIAKLLMEGDEHTATRIARLAYDGTNTDVTNVIATIKDLLKEN